MRIKIGALCVAGLSLSCLVNLGHTQSLQSDPGFYIRVDAGASFVQNTELESFFYADPVGSDVKFNTGYNFGLAGGYQIMSWLAAEIETGYALNGIDQVEGFGSVEGALTQVPFMAKVVLQVPNLGKFLPYAGAGIGGASSILTLDDTFTGRVSQVTVTGSRVDVVWGYQLFAGGIFNFNERMGVGVHYRFLATQGPEWDYDIDGFAPDLYSGKISFGDVYTHSISAVFRYKF